MNRTINGPAMSKAHSQSQASSGADRTEGVCNVYGRRQAELVAARGALIALPTLGRLLLRRLLLLLLLHGRVRVAIRGSTVSYTCQ